jgi:hypothetical protein
VAPRTVPERSAPEKTGLLESIFRENDASRVDFGTHQKSTMAHKSTVGGKVGTRTLQKCSPGGVLKKHEKSMEKDMQNESF